VTEQEARDRDLRRRITGVLAEMDLNFQAARDDGGRAIWNLNFDVDPEDEGKPEPPVSLVIVALKDFVTLYHITDVDWKAKAHELLRLTAVGLSQLGVDQQNRLVISSTVHEHWLSSMSLKLAIGAVIALTRDVRKLTAASA
jgi:hypothetical protein